MTQKSTSFTPSIIDEVEEQMSVGDKYNVWTDDGHYVTPGTVCYTSHGPEGVIVAVTMGGAWPMFVIETISEDSPTAWKPVDNDGQLDGFEDRGVINEIQKEGSDYSKRDSMDYEAGVTVNQWEAGNWLREEEFK